MDNRLGSRDLLTVELMSNMAVEGVTDYNITTMQPTTVRWKWKQLISALLAKVKLKTIKAMT